MKRLFLSRKKIKDIKTENISIFFKMVYLLIYLSIINIFILLIPNLIYAQSELPNWITNIELNKAWSISNSSSLVTIAILDSGINETDVCFKEKIIKKYNVIDNNSNVNDNCGHGTCVASICVGNYDEKRNIYGVCPKAKIIIIKVINATGECSPENLAEGISYAVKNNAKIINISLGTYIYSQILKDSIDYALSKGCIIVACAGNDRKGIIQYPACFPGVISVGSSDNNNNKAFFSNYGSDLEVLAPGMLIPGAYLNGTYKKGNGTSLSTPIISGICALVMEQFPLLTQQQIKKCIFMSCNDLNIGAYPYNKGRDIYSGYGIVNAFKALKYANILMSQKYLVTNEELYNDILSSNKWYKEAYLYFRKLKIKELNPDDNLTKDDCLYILKGYFPNLIENRMDTNQKKNSPYTNKKEFISRDELVSIIVKSLYENISNTVYSNLFIDFNDITNENKKFITFAFTTGIIKGTGFKIFNAKEKATYSELLQILYNIKLTCYAN